MSTLEEILQRDRVLTSDKLREAQALKNEHGGNLDTAILDLGLLPENEVHAYCAAVYGVTPATRSEVMNAAYDVVRMLTREFSVRHRAIPVACNGPSLVIVVDRLMPEQLVNEIRKELKFEPVQRVVATARMEAGLAQHYGVELSTRMRHLVDRLDMRDPGVIPYIARYEGRGTRSELPAALTAARPLRSSSVPAAPLFEVTATRSNPVIARNVMPRAGAYSGRPANAEILGRSAKGRSSLPQVQPQPKGVPIIGSWRAPLQDVTDAEAPQESLSDPAGNGFGVLDIQQELRESGTGKFAMAREPVLEEITNVVVKVGEDIREVIASLSSSTPDTAKHLTEALLAMGEFALPALAREFPGAVRTSADPNSEPLFEPGSVSPVFNAMFAFGKEALPYVWALLTHEHPLKRYYAILLLVRLEGSSSCSKIWRSVLDSDERVSQLALRVISYVPVENTQLIEQVLEQVRVMLRLEGRDRQKLKAVQLLSELRDANAVRMLIETLEQTGDEEVRRQTRQALIRITTQDFGDKATKWTTWYDKNHKADRLSWLIAGLSNADPNVRKRAVEELRKFSNDDLGYEATGSKFARRRAVRRWESWYNERARSA